MKCRTIVLAIATATTLFSPQLFAQSIFELNVREPIDEWTWTLGLALGAAPDYQGADNHQPGLIPVAQMQKGYRFGKLIGLYTTSNFIDSPHWRLGPSFNFRQGYKDVGKDRVDNLTNRGSSYEVGANGGYQFNFQGDASLLLAFEALVDVSSGHDGALFTPYASYSRPLDPRWDLGLGASVTYASGNYMSHFFSVNRSDSLRTGLSEFDADADFKDASLYVLLNWRWTKRWHIHGGAMYQRILGDAEDSPIVEVGNENQFIGVVAVAYSWD